MAKLLVNQVSSVLQFNLQITFSLELQATNKQPLQTPKSSQPQAQQPANDYSGLKIAFILLLLLGTVAWIRRKYRSGKHRVRRYFSESIKWPRPLRGGADCSPRRLRGIGPLHRHREMPPELIPGGRTKRASGSSQPQRWRGYPSARFPRAATGRSRHARALAGATRRRPGCGAPLLHVHRPPPARTRHRAAACADAPRRWRVAAARA